MFSVDQAKFSFDFRMGQYTDKLYIRLTGMENRLYYGKRLTAIKWNIFQKYNGITGTV